MPVNFSDEQISNYDDKKNKNVEKKESLMDKINNFLLRFSRVPLKEKLFFVQHLKVMLHAGISLSKAVKTLSLQADNKYFQKILTDIGNKIEKGNSFSSSLAPYHDVFGEMFISMIEAGEISG